MSDGALQAWLASIQFEAEDVGKATGDSWGVWEEDGSRWGNQSPEHNVWVFYGKAPTNSYLIFNYWLTGDMSSISGSESDSEEGDSDGDGGGTSSSSSLVTGRTSSKVVFQNSAGQYLSLYRCILHGKAQQVNSVQRVISRLTDISLFDILNSIFCSCNTLVRWWVTCRILLEDHK